MALAKLFRIMDTEGQRWHIAAPTFSEAVETMRAWENEPHGSDDEIVQSVEVVEDLILGGNREDSINDYQLMGFSPYDPPSTDWTLANNLAKAAEELLAGIQPAPADLVKTPTSEYITKIKALRDAVDAYTDIPF